MTTEKNITAQEMRQDVLNRLDASRKAIEELSDDELESIVGGRLVRDQVEHPVRQSNVTNATNIPSEMDAGAFPSRIGSRLDRPRPFLNNNTNAYTPGAGRGE